MRDPFIAVDAGTAVISQSWSRMTSAGLDPDHLRTVVEARRHALERRWGLTA